MSLHDDERFEEIEARLEAERPRLDAHELDRLSLRCRSRSNRVQTTKGEPMRSRIAITAMLVLGLLLSTTGATLAISGSSGSGSAGNAQYPPPPTTPTTPETTPTPPPPTETTPTPPPQTETTPTPPPVQGVQGGGGGGGGVLGQNEESPQPASGTSPAQSESAPAPVVQETRQVATSGGSQLPFTGFAVIPIIVAGVALLIAGMFLRLRSRPSGS